jgi:hypothetical protein
VAIPYRGPTIPPFAGNVKGSIRKSEVNVYGVKRHYFSLIRVI